MSILLGNLSVEQIENRMGVSFPETIKTDLLENRQESADTSTLKTGEWHCFDIPFTMVCGSRELAQKIFDSMQELISDIKTPLQLSIKEQSK